MYGARVLFSLMPLLANTCIDDGRAMRENVYSREHLWYICKKTVGDWLACDDTVQD